VNYDFYDSVLVEMTYLDQISGHLSLVQGVKTNFSLPGLFNAIIFLYFCPFLRIDILL